MNILIAKEYNGPNDSANGGYTCGLLAGALEYECPEITLRTPPPLDSELRLEVTADKAELWNGDIMVASATPGQLDLDVPQAPSWAEVKTASSGYAGHQNHPFPHCFVCGPARGTEDGLQIFAGGVQGTDLVAAPWVPSAMLADDEGWVRPEFLWCALDCPGAFAVDQKLETPRVLGRLVGQIKHQIKAGEQVRVIGWPLGNERRKAFAGTALIDSTDRICAVASAIWIAL